VPSDKRARQRAAREARLAAEAKQKKRRRQIRNGVLVVVAAGVIVGIAFAVSSGGNGSKSTATTTTTKPSSAQAAADSAAVKGGCPANPATVVNHQKYSAAPPMTIDTAKTYTATVTTTAGPFTIALDPKTAPKTVNNFVFLADKGFFNCNTFWRVVPQEFVQTGDPTGVGTGGPGYTIPDELPVKASPQYPPGSVAMGNTGAPNSGGSQWFVVIGGTYANLQPAYSLFGQVTSGMPVVDQIGADGNPKPSANGVPPKVIERILKVTIATS
jgi:cyclophilin family peptidyl-prolyl cis-trans isomerase